MKRTLIKNAVVVNEGRSFKGSVVVADEKIEEILKEEPESSLSCFETIDAEGCWLLPGIIDEHVHFRDPGLTHKADISSESRAAVAGGVTSVMDMPNTYPQTVTLDALARKFDEMSKKSLVNYSCYFGATNDNYVDFRYLSKHRVCGIKVFMGSSTGNMLVDKIENLRHIFGETDLLIAVHCEDQTIIEKNTEKYKDEITCEDLPVTYHPRIRSVEACYESSRLAVQLANENGARLHLLHITTAKELELVTHTSLKSKRITTEVCIPHLIFTSADYPALGSRIKCNPSIKDIFDRDALCSAVNSGLIDVIATDHAPHLLGEKEGGALKALSGMPMIQYSLVSMLKLVDEGLFTIEKIVEKMCHAPADIYHICNRGYIRSGYQADLVLVKPVNWTLTNKDILSKCQWSPVEGKVFNHRVDKTFVNGSLVYSDKQITNEEYRGQELRFETTN
ncbi:Dihydroorotase [termite gut metagenome]|uniref:Dihydroorotase n=1 Tax=termite gut metagenome TaxID=433724 RepID=A0A5J4S846_9ZZZZ